MKRKPDVAWILKKKPPSSLHGQGMRRVWSPQRSEEAGAKSAKRSSAVFTKQKWPPSEDGQKGAKGTVFQTKLPNVLNGNRQNGEALFSKCRVSACNLIL